MSRLKSEPNSFEIFGAQDRSRAVREPWFWAVMAPLVVSVLSSSVLISHAVIGGDDRVSDGYYKEGVMINHRFEAERLARALDIEVSLNLNTQKQELLVDLQAVDLPESLTVLLSHPYRADQDHLLTLQHEGSGHYRADFPVAIDGRRYVIVSSTYAQADLNWRLTAEIDVSSGGPFQLRANAKSSETMGELVAPEAGR